MTDTQPENKLEPCPCKSVTELRFDRIEVGNWIQVVCNNCGRRGAQGGSHWMAITLWNQDRSRAPVVAPQVDALALKKLSSRIGDVIEESLRSYRCQYTRELPDLENGLALVDLLTPEPDTDVTRGLQELELLADYIASDVDDEIKQFAPSPSSPVPPEQKFDWAKWQKQAEKFCNTEVYAPSPSPMPSEWDILALLQSRAATPTPVEQEQKPIDMILFCPRCGTQHVDAPESDTSFRHRMEAYSLTAEWQDRVPSRWTNPPHRSHLCHNCCAVWRPADVPTNGVAQITTRGKEDNTWTNSAAVPAIPSPSLAAREAAFMNGTELECDGEELRPDGTCAKCERINGRIAAKVASTPSVAHRSALDEIEVALISIADGVSPQDAVQATFGIINRERVKMIEAVRRSPVPAAGGDEGEQVDPESDFPHRCAICSARMDGNAEVCDACREPSAMADNCLCSHSRWDHWNWGRDGCSHCDCTKYAAALRADSVGEERK